MDKEKVKRMLLKNEPNSMIQYACGGSMAQIAEIRKELGIYKANPFGRKSKEAVCNFSKEEHPCSKSRP